MHVPELKRKIDLLVEHRAFPNREAVAKALGRNEVTLRGWANGGSGAAPNTVTSPNVDAFIGLFADALSDLSEDQVKDLLSGPGDDLEAAFKAGAIHSLRSLIDRTADWGAISLYLNDDGLGLVRRARRADPAPRYRVPLGKPFRIECATTSRARFVIALQSAPGGWGMVPCSFDRARKCVDLPGPEEDGQPGFVVEDVETGPHIFVAAQASRPFPAALHQAGRDGVALDRTLLRHFQLEFEAQDQSTRRLFAVAVEFVRPAT